MPIIATLHPDGQTIAKQTVTRVLAAGAQGLYVTVTFPELRKVKQILHVEIETNPVTWVQSHLPQNKIYLNNTVGMSLYVNPTAGTTLGVEVVVIGF